MRIMKNTLMIVLVGLIVILCAGYAKAQVDDGVDLKDENTPAKNAEAPEKVYAQYCRAVHRGDLDGVRRVVNSKAQILWEKSGRQMLGITKNMVPLEPRLLSRRDKKEYQYNYAEMNMEGKSANGRTIRGVVTMIVEKKQWKVYSEKWSQNN